MLSYFYSYIFIDFHTYRPPRQLEMQYREVARDRRTDRNTDRYLFMKTICALLAFSLQQAASTLWSWVGVGHDNLVAMDHALVAVVLWVCGREGRLVA